MSTNERRGNKFLSWELCDINMVRISVSIFDAKWCSDRIKILSSSFSYYNNSTDLRWQRRCFCNNFKLRFNQHPLPQDIYLTKKNDEKREEKRNESKNTSLQKLLLQKSLSSFCGENLWCLICNKFDDYNLIKYKEFKFERIFYFLCLWDEIRGVHLNGKMKKKNEKWKRAIEKKILSCLNLISSFFLLEYSLKMEDFLFMASRRRNYFQFFKMITILFNSSLTRISIKTQDVC